MKSPHCSIVGYTSAPDAERGRAATEAEGQAGAVTIYIVDYRFPMLSGPNKPLEHARVRFDLLAGGNYPFSKPAVQVLSRPLPYSTHVSPLVGTVCLGEGAEKAGGKMLIGHHIIHVMKCLNYDEPDRGSAYEGYVPEAHRYWRKQMGAKPLNPGLAYPALPLDLTHGIVEQPAFFDVDDAPALFEEVGSPTFEPADDHAAPLFAEVP